ncbi:MAG: hypothetical protein WC584_00930 [Candidatus Pacearchaeota archaeon]
MNLKTKAVSYGVLAIVIVLGLNFTILYLLNFPSMATEIIQKYWILIVLLIGGFGLQIGLFTYFRGLNAISCSTTVASGSISSVSMILCCSHYLLNILPFLGAVAGISGLTALSKYTLQFLIIGIVSNIFGVGVIFYQSNKFRKLRKY